MDPLAASPFALLDKHSSLRLVTDAVHEDDALCLALACRALRDALWARFPRRPAETHLRKFQIFDRPAAVDHTVNDRPRVRTWDAAVVGTVARLVWARGLGQPWPEPRAGWQAGKICIRTE
jgi:hypothetical protein